ncbi:MAG TPA: SUMF1/EgtB/PvdO family nonheme iron enzyme [Thermoguttaceae bacterium]|nr:SUMF1/EgtB/PvdO family nonheme iron enzyme [Thermoguttaceae bacterium]
MAISLDQFVENLTRSSLFSTDELTAFQEGLPPERRPKDAQGLARELLRAKRLTRYQASAVYQGKIKGLVFGEYTVLDQIGAGGMGQVLKARHRTMDRIVALKVLPRRAMHLPEAVQRFRREARAAAKLQHPNIVTAFDAGEAEGIHFLVMQYVDGKDLAQLAAERGLLPVHEAVDYVVQAARGLEYAHSEGVVHRDIKPGNLLVDKRGTVKILDMGLARVFEGEETGEDRLTSTGQVMGTCDYMAPEQAEDTHRADHRADVYSLGCTLYRLLTGKKPYDGETLIRILLAHREDPIPSLCDARPDVPAELDAVCRKMLAKAPEDRYQSMTEVIGALEACVDRREPAARAAAAEASGDGALTSFLQHLSQREAAPEPPPAPAAEQTLRSQVERGTARSAWKKLIPRKGSPAKLYLGIAGGAAALVVVAAMLFLLLGRGGEDGRKPPEGEVVARPAEGAVESTGQEEQEPPPGTSGQWPADTDLPKAQPAAVEASTEEGARPPKPQAEPQRGPRSEPQTPADDSGVPMANAAPPASQADPEDTLPDAVAPFSTAQAKRCQRAWAKHLGVPVETTNSIGMKLVLIPPGEYEMGAPQSEIDQHVAEATRQGVVGEYLESVRSEGPRHRVRLTRPFYVGQHETTVDQFRRFVEATGHKTDAERSGQGRGFYLAQPDGSYKHQTLPQLTWRTPGYAQDADHPVVLVSWNDAAAFCEWLGQEESKAYRLPTEAEWEYVCRAGTTTRWYCGDDLPRLAGSANIADAALKRVLPTVPDTVSWDDGHPYTSPGGTGRPNAFGLYGTHGNAWEWCRDWYDPRYYERSPVEDPPGPDSGTVRIFRGAAWNSATWLCSSACRAVARDMSFSSNTGGFRVVCEIPESAQ